MIISTVKRNLVMENDETRDWDAEADRNDYERMMEM
jgi:hypothetical protein